MTGRVLLLLLPLTAVALSDLLPEGRKKLETAPTVDIAQGSLVGTRRYSRDGREYSAFLNIPFAVAGRFESPKPAPGWTGIRMATEDGPECAYLTWFTNDEKGSEDCLYLNVFKPTGAAPDKSFASYVSLFKPISAALTPHNDTDEGTEAPPEVVAAAAASLTTPATLLPVIVLFFGGSFSLQHSHVFNEEYMMDEEVVYVTINYRIGPFGFLSTEDDTLSGNYGLKDQRVALQWIQKNIEKFGGDPKSVTILGVKAGSVSAHLHLLSPKSEGLFHAAILQSGTALNPWAMHDSPYAVAKKLGKTVGCRLKGSARDFKSCLAGKKTAEILMAVRKMFTKDFHPITPFGPVIESREFSDSFLTQDPFNGTVVNKVPVMIGLPENEDIFDHTNYIFSNPALLKELNFDWEHIFPVIFEYSGFYSHLSKKKQRRVTRQVRKFYFNNEKISYYNVQDLRNAFADRLLNQGVRRTILSLGSQIPVYPYILSDGSSSDGSSDFNVMESMPGTPQIISNFVKHKELLHNALVTEHTIKNSVGLMVSFAKNKKPSKLWGKEKSWPPLSEEELSGEQPILYYKLDANTDRIPEPFQKRVIFWDQLLNEMAKKRHQKKA